MTVDEERNIVQEMIKTDRQDKFLAGTNIPVRFLLGGFVFRPGRVTFDFNFTFVRNSTEPFRRIGLLAVSNR